MITYPPFYDAISIIGSYNTISIILFIIFLGWFLLKMMKSGEETLGEKNLMENNKSTPPPLKKSLCVASFYPKRHMPLLLRIGYAFVELCNNAC